MFRVTTIFVPILRSLRDRAVATRQEGARPKTKARIERLGTHEIGSKLATTEAVEPNARPNG